MATKKPDRRRRRPATTPEARENQLISLSYDLAEKQLVEGTASSQTMVHFLKMASSREKLEQERLHRENLLLSAKVDQIHSMQKTEELYQNALNAMREYSGQPENQFELEEGYDD